MKWPASMLAAALVAGMAGPTAAGQVKLEIRGGFVSLDAKDATPREILLEWARVGQTRVVNAEKVLGGPVTLLLTDVPERQALETVLRSAAGFIAAPRENPQPSLSTYDRIVLMPGMRPAVVPTVGAPAPVAQSPGFRGRTFLQPATPAADEDTTDQNATPQLLNTPAGQRPGGLPFANPYAPTTGAQITTTAPVPPGMAPPQTVPRPGMPTAPPPPIK
jgi:hypothetical protein